ncbi:Developmentally regulated GTP-binding protein [Cavenderia fasciculata]|uniref:Developmentally regulated GTP-binding protein n=1 Tax=Cavenderia fasciculata TaxID=261658 RepID=F4Q5D5_CACFS|nr:Developmentally regulated GTP-binding protein [Cavenderia fasciculata]EGG17194.1 Developmentally regulated GTP-binding protein [Cavenderia fasciculata]|eukprot:XP_004355678.1 Developmentally regulated GTP-binding protein [Cavenderia fasciculata]
MGILEKIKDIESEMSRTQKNKATEHHLGMLKAKLAKLRATLLEPPKSSGKTGEGFEVLKSGDARVALIGFPSVGKSTILTKLTDTQSAQADYEFTTLTCIPGVIQYHGARIQLLDTPGIIEGASQGRGRGKQVISVARTADLILMMLDSSKGEIQKRLLEEELEAIGIRLNSQPPNIYYKLKSAGGVNFTATQQLTKVTEKLVKSILHEYKIFNCDLVIRCDPTVDEVIDAIEGRRSYIKCLYVYNKIDQLSIEETDRISRLPNSVVISCNLGLNLDFLLDKIWEYLSLVRVYTKKRGEAPDFNDAVILRAGASVEHVCQYLHKELANQFKYGIVWGVSAKHCPQRVGLAHLLDDEDVIQIVKK